MFDRIFPDVPKSSPASLKAKQPRTKPEGKDQVVCAVMDAAEQLFSQFPTDQVTTRMLAQLADVNLGLIHRHLGSKDDVLHSLMERYATFFKEEVGQCDNPSAAFAMLLADPVQVGFVRTLAFAVLSGTDLNDVLSHGAIKELVGLAKATGDSKVARSAARDREIAAKVVVGWSLMFGWQLFRPFLLQAAGIRTGEADVEAIITEKLQGLFAKPRSTRP